MPVGDQNSGLKFTNCFRILQDTAFLEFLAFKIGFTVADCIFAFKVVNNIVN